MLYHQNQPIPTHFPSEASLQQYCVSWWKVAYPNHLGALYAIKNNSRNRIEGSQDQSLGVFEGVADLCLLLPDGKSQYIEMKLPDNYQSPAQKRWEKLVVSLGHRYTVVKTYVAFRELIQMHYGGKG